MNNALPYRPPSPWARFRVPLIGSSAYLVLSAALVGFKADQLVLVGIFTMAWSASDASRRWVLGFAIFMLYWVLFDWMKALPNHMVSAVHIGDLYDAERALFGIAHQGTVLTPNEWLALHTAPFLDVLAGLFYLCWVPVPLGFAAYLFARDKGFFLRFALCFLLVNLLGFAVYYLYPAAPPWYVAQYGLDLVAETPGNPAGLDRFDAISAWGYSRGSKGKSSNVFAAMPSLHAAYLLVAGYWAHRAGVASRALRRHRRRDLVGGRVQRAPLHPRRAHGHRLCRARHHAFQWPVALAVFHALGRTLPHGDRGPARPEPRLVHGEQQRPG
ncbi:MAG: phosphatase PAP2 family protein [Flavobacteriales bacterium]|nr:phosphatase PAP2 family protein [Flavobacteriales bacterium]